MSKPNPVIMKSIEDLNYRVTIGDVSANSGLDLQTVQPEIIKIAADTQCNLQVAQTGDIAYVFPPNFRSILQSKYWKLRWQKWLDKAWQIVFYLIRISFGILLVSSIVLMLLAIVVLVVVISSKGDDSGDSGGGSRRGGGGGFFFLPRFWFSPDFFWLFSPNYQQRRYERQIAIREQGQQGEQSEENENQLNFLESIYSFLFGDGAPNPRLEQSRWQQVATVINNNRGAIIAEQAAPYLDNINIYNERDEEYILPVLTRFNGYPEVSELGDIIYYFPELQVTAEASEEVEMTPYLEENLWEFSLASSGQKIFAIFLGGINFILALILGSMLTPELAQQIGGLIAFVDSIYIVLLVYAVSYLTIPLIRYFWLQRRNNKIITRNEARKKRAQILHNNSELRAKINYAQRFATQQVIEEADIVYSTEENMLDQSQNLTNDWDRRLSEGSN